MVAQTFNQALEIETTKRIDEEIVSQKNTLAAGQLPDHATYKYHSGIVQGLEKAKMILEGALLDIQKS